MKCDFQGPRPYLEDILKYQNIFNTRFMYQYKITCTLSKHNLTIQSEEDKTSTVKKL